MKRDKCGEDDDGEPLSGCQVFEMLFFIKTLSGTVSIIKVENGENKSLVKINKTRVTASPLTFQNKLSMKLH